MQMLLSMVSLNSDILQVQKILLYQPKGFRYHSDEQYSGKLSIPKVNKNTCYH